MLKACKRVTRLSGVLPFLVLIIYSSCGDTAQAEQKSPAQKASALQLLVLGTVQDAGSPQLGCTKACCRKLYQNPDPTRRVVSLGLIDRAATKSYLIEATPDITQQINMMHGIAGPEFEALPSGIFLTHAHIGHYTGLMYLGKEAVSAKQISVYAMPRMKEFLEKNGPWNALVTNKNIVLNPLQDSTRLILGPQLRILPFLVPHRDEYSETVGYTIEGPKKKALFIPDIDKWYKWDASIIQAIKGVDYAFLDAGFYDESEITHRDISEIPHPFVVESMKLFKDLPASEKAKIYFIHLNHTNPLLDKSSAASQKVLAAGFNIATIHSTFDL